MLVPSGAPVTVIVCGSPLYITFLLVNFAVVNSLSGCSSLDSSETGFSLDSSETGSSLDSSETGTSLELSEDDSSLCVSEVVLSLGRI